MREFRSIKQSGSVWHIMTKHEHAGYDEKVAEFYDQDMASSVVIFLNERERVFEKQRLEKLEKAKNSIKEST